MAIWKAKGKAELSIWCVKCGTRGNTTIAGQLDYNIRECYVLMYPHVQNIATDC